MTRAWVEIDLGALRRNGEAMAAAAGVPILPMVKADAYGLGAARAVDALEGAAPWGYGVATIREAEELRRLGVERSIVVFTPLLLSELDAAHRARVTPALHVPAAIERWGDTGLAWHLQVDTGMMRAGVRWDEVPTLRSHLEQHPPEGVFTHFHSAEVDDGTRGEQERRFAEALAHLPARPPLVYVENGAAVAWPGVGSRFDLVRPGIFLYGVAARADAPVQPEPVVRVRARVVDVRGVHAGESVSYLATWRADRECRVATLAIGYADGYRRHLSNRAHVLLHGERCAVAGLVTMDMTMIDVTDVQCAVGDVATLIGGDGSATLTVAEVAQMGDLSPYELLTGLRGRLPRLYVGADG